MPVLIVLGRNLWPYDIRIRHHVSLRIVLSQHRMGGLDQLRKAVRNERL